MSIGGKRAGAGRKPDPNKRLVVSYTLPREVVEYLATQPNKSHVVEQAIVRSAAFRKWREGRGNCDGN